MISYQVEEFGQPLARVLRQTPQPQGGEILLKVDSCGVCHSDVHLHDGYFDLGGGQKLDTRRSVNPPRTLGHEIAGTVVAVGPDAQGVQLGDRRVVFPWIGCNLATCAICAAGDEHLCNAPQGLGVQRDGGFADHVIVPAARYLLDHGSLPAAQACTYACSGLTAFSALKKLAPLFDATDVGAAAAPGPALLIIGAGGVGLSGIRLARELYPQARIIVAEIDARKWDIAREAGADELLDPSADGAAKALAKGTAGGVAAAIDFVGAGSSFSFGFAALRKGGRLVCVGLMGGAATLMPVMVSMKAVSIIGSYVGSLAEMQALMAIARRGQLPALPVQSQSLDTATQALDELRGGRIWGRTVLQP